MSEKTEILKTWYRRVWEEADLSAIGEMFRPNAEAHGLMQDMHVGPEEFEVFASAFHQLVENVAVDVRHSIEQGDWISARMKLSCDDPTTGKRIEIPAITYCKIVEGIIVEAHNQFDAMTFFEQIGLLPPESFAVCLMGEAIG